MPISGESGRHSTDLKVDLVSSAQRMSFFQAVRLFELYARKSGIATETGIGGAAKAKDEPVRLHSSFVSHFPETEISGIDINEDGQPADIFVNMMGLIGPSGVLPFHYTEYVMTRQRRRDQGFVQFLDVFHHRTLSLFYRAWKKYRLDISSETTGIDGEDPISIIVRSVMGLYGDSLKDRLSVRDVSILGYAGKLSRRVNAATLEALVEDAGGAKAKVLPFQGSWVHIADEDQTQLGGASEGAWSTLGRFAVVGSTYWDVQRKFRIAIGPVDWETFQAYLPGGPLHKRIGELVRLAVGPGLDFDFEILVGHNELPPLQITEKGFGARLGWSSWLPEMSPRQRTLKAIIPSYSRDHSTRILDRGGSKGEAKL